MARLEDPMVAGAVSLATSPSSPVVLRRKEHITMTATTTTVVSSDNVERTTTETTVKREVTVAAAGTGDRSAEEETTTVSTVERAPAASSLTDGEAATTAAAASALPPPPRKMREIPLPDRDAVEARWGPDRTAFAARSSLPRFDETEEEAREHDAIEAAAFAARAKLQRSASRNPNAKGGGDARNRRGGGGGGGEGGGGGGNKFFRSMSRGRGGDNDISGAPSSMTSSAPPAMQTPPRKNPVPSTSWTPISGRKFSVRCGPNYRKHGRKAPSSESLYETAAVRCYRSDARTIDVADVLPLPIKEAFGGMEEERTVVSLPDVFGDKVFVPDLLVVHFQMPYESPNMFKPKDDGRGGEVVFYLKPSQRFLDELAGARPATPASCHFIRWCQTCDADFDVRSQFKCMALVRNLDRHNLGWLSPYNGKPVLITESGKARRGVTAEGVRFLEMSANVHKWAFLAKKGFVSLIPRFREMRINVGFTVEAAADTDMPECILGAVGVNYIDESTVPRMEETMRGKRDGAGNVKIAPAVRAAAKAAGGSMRGTGSSDGTSRRDGNGASAKKHVRG